MAHHSTRSVDIRYNLDMQRLAQISTLLVGVFVLGLGGMLLVVRARGPSVAMWLAFVSSQGDDIYRVLPDGRQLQRLTHQPGPDIDPVWTPDGRFITYSDGHLRQMRPNGQAAALLSAQSGFDGAWSPDGEWLAFVTEEYGAFEILKMRPDGSQVERLTDNGGQDYGPRWSPDGQWIVFVSDRNGSPDIFKMRADGSEVQRLTSTFQIETDPDWSPDGEWIVFAALGELRYFDIYRMRPNGKQVQRLTDHLGEDSAPAWSPDGQWIVFQARRSQTRQLFLMRPDGSQVRQITALAGDAADPTWSPVIDLPLRLPVLGFSGLALAGLGLVTSRRVS
jgi:Tol biopolymer transport system component